SEIHIPRDRGSGSDHAMVVENVAPDELALLRGVARDLARVEIHSARLSDRASLEPIAEHSIDRDEVREGIGRYPEPRGQGAAQEECRYSIPLHRCGLL